MKQKTWNPKRERERGLDENKKNPEAKTSNWIKTTAFDAEKGSSLVGTAFILQVDELLRAGSRGGGGGFRNSTKTPRSLTKPIRQ